MNDTRVLECQGLSRVTQCHVSRVTVPGDVWACHPSDTALSEGPIRPARHGSSRGLPGKAHHVACPTRPGPVTGHALDAAVTCVVLVTVFFMSGRAWPPSGRRSSCSSYVSPISACLAEGKSMVRMTWLQATPQRLEPVGPDSDCGAGVPRRTRRAGPGRRHRNTTAVSSYDTGAGPEQPRSQQARLTRTTSSPTTARF